MVIAHTAHTVRMVNPTSTCYHFRMRAVSIQQAQERLAALAKDVENRETVVVTRNGRPVFSMVPHRQAGGLRLDAVADLEREHGVEAIATYVADDFDAPLPEDFLLGRCLQGDVRGGVSRKAQAQALRTERSFSLMNHH